jgi:hypothetical protein
MVSQRQLIGGGGMINELLAPPRPLDDREWLALAAFGLQKMMMAEEPLIVDITTRIMADESRHVAFGVLSLEEVTRSYTASELREREDFQMEATHLMRFENMKDGVEAPDVMPPQRTRIERARR